jgi:two-component system, cell cycle sensor histidine kinase and response regulator CckA
MSDVEDVDPELLRSAMELVERQLPIVYWIVDRDLKIIKTGGAIESTLGYPRGRWLGSTLRDVQRVDGGSEDPAVAHERALAGETVTYQNRYRDKQMSVTVGPYRKGDFVGAVGIAIDITSLHVLERRMVDAQRAESLGVLAGGLAHDFNNLLVAIIGNADLGLRDVRPGMAGHASLENIRTAGLQAAELTDQLLAYAGRGGVTTTSVAPRSLVEELLKIASPTFPRNVTVDVDIPDGLAMRGDPAQVRQVVLNLIGNAREALGARGGRITVAARSVRCSGEPDADDVVTPAAGDYLELAFTDNGPGIDRETRRRIFEPFFTTKSSGHGLGLAAVVGIVRTHGGGLRLVSEPGEGARFEVLWQATTTPPGQAIVAAPARAADARTVLVIDDEDLVRDVVARMIEDLGYAAVTAADGPSGLAILDRQPVHAVLVDLSMPRMSGADVIAAVREKRPGLPVVLCSGYDRDRRGPVQADAYLPKPFRIEALEQALAKVLP